MKKNKLKILLILVLMTCQIPLKAQVIYPPNHSFEDDSITYGIKPWNAVGNFEIITSVNMHFAADKKYFIELLSSKINSVYTYTKLQIKFPISERVRFLNFASMFRSNKYENKFRVKYQLTKYNPINKSSYQICNMDTMMDTICNIRGYRNAWFKHKIDLKPYYLSNETPDTCYIELSCDFKHLSSADFIQVLDLDNFVLTGNVDDQVSVQDQFKSAVDIKVYPNPSEGSFIVDLSALTDVAKLEVLSANGQTVMFLDDPEELIHLDLSAYARSCYLLKIVSTNGNVQCKKLLLE